MRPIRISAIAACTFTCTGVLCAAMPGTAQAQAWAPSSPPAFDIALTGVALT